MNIEAEIINYLMESLETDEVYGTVPDSPTSEFLVVDKTGSSTENFITTSTIAIQSYAPTKAAASELNEKVKAVMRDIARFDSIGGCRLNTDYNFTNVARKQYRYQAIFNITHY